METRVMVVDDDRLIRETLKAFFTSEGVNVLTAASGDACLEYLNAGFRGVILMDVMMPAMNGWDTIRKIVECNLFEGNLIVMLTALDEPDNKIEGIQEYVTDYMTKPFLLRELMERLRYYSSILNVSHTDNGQ